MPNFIGNKAPAAATQIEDNARASGNRVRITYSQMIRLPAAAVMYSLDTTDKGGINSRAKRWYRWFTTAEAIEACPTATSSMRRRAGLDQ